MSNVTLEKKLYDQFKHLITAIIPEFDGTAEKDISAVAEEGLRAAIKAKLAELSAAYAAKCIRTAIQEEISKHQVPAFVSMDDLLYTGGTAKGDDDTRTIGSTLVDTSPTPMYVARLEDSIARVELVLSKFNPQAQIILRMRLFWAYCDLEKPASFKQIAVKTGLSESTVQRKYEDLFEFIKKVQAAGNILRIPKEFSNHRWHPTSEPNIFEDAERSGDVAKAYQQDVHRH